MRQGEAGGQRNLVESLVFNPTVPYLQKASEAGGGTRRQRLGHGKELTGAWGSFSDLLPDFFPVSGLWY